MSEAILIAKLKIEQARLALAVQYLEELADAVGCGYDAADCANLAKRCLWRMAHEVTKLDPDVLPVDSKLRPPSADTLEEGK